MYKLTTAVVGGHVVAVVGTRNGWRLLLRIIGVGGACPVSKHAGDLHVMRRRRRVVAREVGLRNIVYGDLQKYECTNARRACDILGKLKIKICGFYCSKGQREIHFLAM